MDDKVIIHYKWRACGKRLSGSGPDKNAAEDAVDKVWQKHFESKHPESGIPTPSASSNGWGNA